MNFKEAFRYQTFLDESLAMANALMSRRDLCLIYYKNHLKSKVTPDEEDMVEVVDGTEDSYPIEDVVAVALILLKEKESITKAVSDAKKQTQFDIDVATSTNVRRQNLAKSLERMLLNTPMKYTERGIGRRFNAEGNQVEYFYEVEVEAKDSYDRKEMKKITKELWAESDRVSTEIDAVKINSVIDFCPKFDVNDSFDDIMEKYQTELK